MDYDIDHLFQLPPSGDFAEKAENEIYNKYEVSCYFEEIIKYLDFSNQKNRIGWIILLPEELSKQFDEQVVWDEFQFFIKYYILSKNEFGLRFFTVSKREIRLIYGSDATINQYIEEHLINKNW